MDFFKKLFARSIKKSMTTEENTNITKEPSLNQCYPQGDHSNESESYVIENNDENNSSVACINEFGCTKIYHNLENVAPIEISANDYTNKEPDNKGLNDDMVSEDATILNITAVASSAINAREDEPVINHSEKNLQPAKIPYEAEVSNEVTHNTDANTINVIDDETIKSLKEFEEAFNNIDKTTLSGDFGSDLINLDEIFNEIDTVNDYITSIDSSSILENNKIGTYFKEKEITNLNKEIHSNINENLDIISINSSTEDEKSDTVELKDVISIHTSSDEADTDDGYNSSDFEFISETEAKMTGIIINFEVEKYQNRSQASPEPVIQYCIAEERDPDGENVISSSDEGPSRQNKPRNEFEDRSYRNDHQVPVGDNFLGLFQGIYNPLLPMSEIYFLENKSVRTSAMNSQYDGIGFDKQLALRRHQPDSSEDEFEEEARESAKNILSMYPGQNRKRRRRFL